MSDVTLSPNMSLPVPIVSIDAGPDWANNVNSCLSILDQHNHSSGSGVQISQDGISLSATTTSTYDSLSFNGTNAYALRSVRFTAQVSPLALATDVGCLYESGVDLYYNDGSANQIRLTQGGSIVGSAGSITGLPSGTASASYSAGTFVWQSATSTAAAMDNGPVTIRQVLASAKGVTLNSPNALAADYSLSFPAALPGATSFLQLDSSGNIGASVAVSGGITTSNIASGTIVGANLTTNINLPGTAVQEGGLNVVVSSVNATKSLSVVRGLVNSAGTILSGEGFSVNHAGTGSYILTFTGTFADIPSVVPVIDDIPNSSIGVQVSSVSASSVTIFTYSIGGTGINRGFAFIAMGQRP